MALPFTFERKLQDPAYATYMANITKQIIAFRTANPNPHVPLPSSIGDAEDRYNAIRIIDNTKQWHKYDNTVTLETNVDGYIHYVQLGTREHIRQGLPILARAAAVGVGNLAQTGARTVGIALRESIYNELPGGELLRHAVGGIGNMIRNHREAAARRRAGHFKKGGFTGFGNPNEEAGVVHKGEYVIPANLVQTNKSLIDHIESQRTGQGSSSGIEYGDSGNLMSSMSSILKSATGMFNNDADDKSNEAIIARLDKLIAIEHDNLQINKEMMLAYRINARKDEKFTRQNNSSLVKKDKKEEKSLFGTIFDFLSNIGSALAGLALLKGLLGKFSGILGGLASKLMKVIGLGDSDYVPDTRNNNRGFGGGFFGGRDNGNQPNASKLKFGKKGALLAGVASAIGLGALMGSGDSEAKDIPSTDISKPNNTTSTDIGKPKEESSIDTSSIADTLSTISTGMLAVGAGLTATGIGAPVGAALMGASRVVEGASLALEFGPVIYDALKDSDIAKSVTGFFGDTVDNATELTKGMGDKLSDSVDGAIGGVKSFFGFGDKDKDNVDVTKPEATVSGINAVKDVVTETAPAPNSETSKPLESQKSLLGSLWDKGSNAISGAIDTVKNSPVLSTVASLTPVGGVNAVKDMVAGTVPEPNNETSKPLESQKSLLGSLWDKGSNAVSGVIDTVKQSPVLSTVASLSPVGMAVSGVNAVKDIVTGKDTGKDNVDVTKPEPNNETPKPLEPQKSLLGSLWDKGANAVSGAIDTVKNSPVLSTVASLSPVGMAVSGVNAVKDMVTGNDNVDVTKPEPNNETSKPLESQKSLLGSLWDKGANAISGAIDTVKQSPVLSTVASLSPVGMAVSGVNAVKDMVTGKDNATKLAEKEKQTADTIDKLDELDIARFEKEQESISKSGSLLDEITNIKDSAIETISGMTDPLTDSISESVEALSKSISGIGEESGGIFSDTFSSISGFLSNVASRGANLVTRGVNSVVDTYNNVKGSVTGAYNNASNATGGVFDRVRAGYQSIKSDVTGTTAQNKDILMKEMNRAGITDPKEQAIFLARMDHESGGFRKMSENLSYSVEGIKKTFGGNRGIAGKSDAELQQLAHNPEALANVVYSDSNRGTGSKLGNTEPGDGWKYRGRGYAQLTGKSNYEQAGRALKLDLVNNPDLASQPDVAAQIATWFWESRNIGEKARKGDLIGAVKTFNGGTNGLEDTAIKSNQYFAEIQSGKLDIAAAGTGIVTPASAITPPSNVSDVKSTAGLTPPIGVPIANNINPPTATEESSVAPSTSAVNSLAGEVAMSGSTNAQPSTSNNTVVSSPSSSQTVVYNSVAPDYKSTRR